MPNYGHHTGIITSPIRDNKVTGWRNGRVRNL